MWIVSIEERWDPGSPYRIVATNSQRDVKALEDAANKAGLEAIVRNSDGVRTTLDWIQQHKPPHQEEGN